MIKDVLKPSKCKIPINIWEFLARECSKRRRSIWDGIKNLVHLVGAQSKLTINDRRSPIMSPIILQLHPNLVTSHPTSSLSSASPPLLAAWPWSSQHHWSHLCPVDFIITLESTPQFNFSLHASEIFLRYLSPHTQCGPWCMMHSTLILCTSQWQHCHRHIVSAM